MVLKFRRLMAALIDYIIIFYTCYAYEYLFSKLIDNIIFKIFVAIVAAVLFINLFIRKDVIFGYESLGKKAMRLKIYDQNGDRIIKRNLLINRIIPTLITFPIYVFMILSNNKSIGDIKNKTFVR